MNGKCRKARSPESQNALKVQGERQENRRSNNENNTQRCKFLTGLPEPTTGRETADAADAAEITCSSKAGPAV